MKLRILLSFVVLSFVGIFFQNCAEDFDSALKASSMNSTESASETHIVDLEDCSSGECPDPNLVQACMFNGEIVLPGETVTAYKESSVPYGSTCKSENRLCGSTGLTGTAQYDSCSVGAPASCLHKGINVPHGQLITAYSKSTVPYGQSCSPVSLSCSNGDLSPDPSATPYTSCTVGAPAACTYKDGNLAHGQKIMAYTKATVPYGQKCVALQVSCNNGDLSNAAAIHSTCTVEAPVVKWVNAVQGKTHMQTCSGAGLFPAKDKGYGICASGEARPQQGTDYEKISYRHGKWGSNSKYGGNKIVGGYGYYLCYRDGQKQDNDSTDVLVAYLCSQEPNTVDTTPPLRTWISGFRDGP